MPAGPSFGTGRGQPPAAVCDRLPAERRTVYSEPGFGASVPGSLTTVDAGSPSRPRLWAAWCWPRLRPLPHPLRFCAGTATSSQPSTMAARTGAQADLRRRRTSVSSLYAWRRRTRRGDIRACGAHSRTSNTDTKLLIYGLFQKGRVLAQDADVARMLALCNAPSHAILRLRNDAPQNEERAG